MPRGYKTGGRTKGTPNKATAEIRQTIMRIINEGITTEFINELAPDKKADVLLRLLPYVISKYADIPSEQLTDSTVTITIDSPLVNKDLNTPTY